MAEEGGVKNRGAPEVFPLVFLAVIGIPELNTLFWIYSGYVRGSSADGDTIVCITFQLSEVPESCHVSGLDSYVRNCLGSRLLL